MTVVCGGGNNGGDGRVAARYLEQPGARCASSTLKGDDHDLGSPGVVVDALFGTGFSGAPRDDAAGLIEAINALDAPVVAVDVPSGVDASTGEVAGAAVEAARHGHVPRREGRARASRLAASTPAASRSWTSASSRARRRTRSSTRRSCGVVPRRGANRPDDEVHAPARCSSSAARRG